jgi:hypothetical protein
MQARLIKVGRFADIGHWRPKLRKRGTSIQSHSAHICGDDRLFGIAAEINGIGRSGAGIGSHFANASIRRARADACR